FATRCESCLQPVLVDLEGASAQKMAVYGRFSRGAFPPTPALQRGFATEPPMGYGARRPTPPAQRRGGTWPATPCEGAVTQFPLAQIRWEARRERAHTRSSSAPADIAVCNRGCREGRKEGQERDRRERQGDAHLRRLGGGWYER